MFVINPVVSGKSSPAFSHVFDAMLSTLLSIIIIIIIIFMPLFILTGRSSHETKYQANVREVEQAAYTSAYSVVPVLRADLHSLLQ
jgi:hypothetical protein